MLSASDSAGQGTHQRRAGGPLGTTGFKDTVEAALQEVIALDARLRVIAQLQSSSIDVDTLREEAWGA